MNNSDYCPPHASKDAFTRADKSCATAQNEHGYESHIREQFPRSTLARTTQFPRINHGAVYQFKVSY